MKTKRKNLSKKEILHNLTPIGKMELYIAKFFNSGESKHMTDDEVKTINRIRNEHEQKHESLIKTYEKDVDDTLMKYMTLEHNFIKDKIWPRLTNKK